MTKALDSVALGRKVSSVSLTTMARYVLSATVYAGV